MILEKNLPNNWSIHSVEELFDFINTKSLSRAQLISEEGENQYLHYGDIHSTFKYVLVDTEKIQLPSVLKDVQISGNIEFLKDGDLVIADASEDLDGVAKCIELKNIGVKKVIGGLHTIVCRDKIGKTANEIRPYLFLNTIVLKSIKRIATGTSVLGISKGRLKEIRLILPPLSEQQKIAQILSTVDDKIEIIEQQIIETQELKKGLMRRLLTKGIGHTEFKDSPLGMIPESWEVVKLSDVCHKIGDGIHSTPKYVDNSEYYFVNGNNLINGTLTVSEKTKCVSKDEYEKLRIHLNLNSILMSINGTIGNLALYKNEEVVFGKSASYISAKEDRLHYLFLYYYLQHSNTKKYFYDELTGSTIKNLSLKTIRNTPTILPSKTEQEKIANTLSLVDEKLKVLSEKKTHYQELKKGLMQQLLTGKIRVKV